MDLQSLAAGSEGFSDEESQSHAGSEVVSMYPYHRTKASSRSFKLIAMQGCPETIVAQLQKAKCELCGQPTASEDPLCPGYFREWAYNGDKPDPRLIASRACGHVSIDQRLGTRAVVV